MKSQYNEEEFNKFVFINNGYISKIYSYYSTPSYEDIKQDCAVIYIEKDIPDIILREGRKRACTVFLQALRASASKWSPSGKQLRKETYERTKRQTQKYEYVLEDDLIVDDEEEIHNRLLIWELRKICPNKISWLEQYYSKENKTRADIAKCHRIVKKIKEEEGI